MSKLEKKCQEHWKQLGINSQEKLRKYIEALFEKHNCQEDVLIGLYRMVFPDWERIRKVKGYPEAGEALWKFICRKFQGFDKKYHPDCMPGGAWMNTGFSTGRNLSPWEISFDNCSAEYV